MPTSEVEPDADAGLPRPGIVSRAATAAVLVGVVVVAFSRSPYLLIHGRLWAEEGTTYLGHMLAEPGPGSLGFVAERTGYLILFSNATTWLAAHLPLAQAGLITAWTSLAVLVLLVAVVLRWPSDLLTTAAARLAAAALLVVGTGAIPEVWLATNNMTTAFGSLALVLLFVRVEELSRRQVAIGIAILAMAGLSGIYAAALAPLFVVVALGALGARSRRRWVWAGVVTAAAAVQVLLLFRSRLSGAMAETRFTDLTFDEVARSVVGLHAGGFALGEPAIGRLADAIDERSWTAGAVVALVVLAIVALAGAIAWRAPNRRVPLLLGAAFVITEVAVLTGSLSHGAPSRYAVVPITIVTFLFVYGATAVADRWLARGATAILVVALVAGLAGFWTAEPTILRCIDCPDWADQIEAWQAGGPNEIEIWPYDRGADWTIKIPDDRRG